jgi:hypothetical protein
VVILLNSQFISLYYPAVKEGLQSYGPGGDLCLKIIATWKVNVTEEMLSEGRKTWATVSDSVT